MHVSKDDGNNLLPRLNKTRDAFVIRNNADIVYY